MKLPSHHFKLNRRFNLKISLKINLKKIYHAFLFSSLLPVFFVLTGVLVSGVYPAYAFERSIFNIVVTSNTYPIVWRKSFAKDLATQLNAQQLLALNLCNADANCSQAAVNAGAIYFKITASSQGRFIAYYNANGKLVGTSPVDEGSTGGSIDDTAPPPPSSSNGNNNFSSQVVGSLGGELAISPTGAANYSIPIEIPPSTKGVSPNLAFSYDSQSGNGVLGMGWAIAGIPEIIRCGANLAIEGYIRPVALTNDDKFCMGGQRLIAVDGAYGANGTEYRTEIDSSQKITSKGNTSFGGPAWFEVETKSGGMMTLGYQEGEYDSRFEANGTAAGLFGYAPIEKWALGKVQDKDGNYYKIAYEEADKTFIGGGIPNVTIIQPSSNHILKIDYTGNDAMGIAPYASVRFEYENRTDLIGYWNAGSKFNLNERLSRVKTFVGNTLVKEYRLSYSYEPVTKNSRLVSLQECSGISGTECKNPTRFNWSNGNKQLKSVIWGGGGAFPSTTRVGDFNGDGKSDLLTSSRRSQLPPYDKSRATLKLSNGSGFDVGIWETEQEFSSSKFTWIGDFDGNGMSDLVSATAGNVYMHLSTGTSFINKTWVVSNLWGGNKYTWTGDFNGDGLTDIASASGGNVYMKLSTGTSFTSKTWKVPNVWGKADYTWTGDFNGDGLTDIASASGTNVYMHLSTGTSFINKTWSVIENWEPSIRSWVGDFNGDGLTDIASTNGIQLFMRFSTGKSFTNKTWVTPFLLGTTTRTWVGEFNGDGKSDIVSVSANGTRLYVHSPTESSLGLYAIPVTGQWGTSANSVVADLNGDGMSDIYSLFRPYSTSPIGTNYVKLSTDKTPNLLNTITDGFGNRTDIAYKHLTDDSIYERGAIDEGAFISHAPKYPFVNIQAAKIVVASKTTSDGLKGTTKTSYKYGGERNHLKGRGNLGFKWAQSTNEDTGLTTKTYFNQNFPYIGMVTTETQTLANYGVISKTIKNHATRNSDKGLPIPYVSTDTTTTYGLDGQLLSTARISSSINEYGDPVTTETTVSDVNRVQYKTTATNEYGNISSPTLCEKSQVTKTTVSKIGPQGTSPSVINNFTYNGCDLSQESGSVNGVTGLTKTHSYNGFGHVTSTTISAADITPRTMTTQYESKGRFVSKITNEHGHEVTTQYDQKFGVVTRSTGINGLVATSQYDAYGRETTTIAPGGIQIKTSRQWCKGCYIPAITPQNARQDVSFSVRQEFFGGAQSSEKLKPDVIRYFDKLGRQVRTETQSFDGRAIHVDTNYDNLGRVSAATQPYFNNAPADKNPLITTYDILSRPIKTQSPDGGEATITYDGLNVSYATTVIDTVGGTTTTQTKTERNNVIGQTLQITDTQNNAIYYEYDAQGNKVKILTPSLNADGSVLDEKGTVTSFVYDVFGRKTAMNDPDMGQWSYTYDSLSKLKSQTDANGNTTTLSYDKLGRLIKRTDADNTLSQWLYNDDLLSTQPSPPAIMGLGKLDTTLLKNPSPSWDEDYQTSTKYEPVLGLPVETTVTISGNAYTTKSSYDRFNRPEILTYPQPKYSTTQSAPNLQLRYVYENGVMNQLQSVDGTTVYWKANVRDAQNRVNYSTLGNGANTWQTFDKVGRASLISVADSNANIIYEAAYKFDTIGNLRQRDVSRSGSGTPAAVAITTKEQYSYDSLNRLISATNNGVATLNNSYDVLGNIRSKSGVGTYKYNTAGKPHAVSSIGNKTYRYDNNGNLASNTDTYVYWKTYNKPYAFLTFPQNQQPDLTTFRYGPNRARYYQHNSSIPSGGHTSDTIDEKYKTTHYIGSLFERVETESQIKYKHYLKANGQTIATYTVANNAPAKLEYLQRDYQGSVVAISDETGNVKAQLGFNAFGSRKSLATTAADKAVEKAIIDDNPRGYTGHEHLDGLDLIHMNGRVYDPIIGRFLSADPFVQAPGNLQSYNRYAYVWNNPMSYTDPSGFWPSFGGVVSSIGGAIGGIGSGVGNAFSNAASSAGNFIKNNAGTIIAPGISFNVAVAYSKPVTRLFLENEWARVAGSVAAGVADTYGCGGCGAFSAAYSAYLTDISGGSFNDIAKSAAISYGTTRAFNAVHAGYGEGSLSSWEKTTKTLAHGAIGGTSARLSGGSFRDGFIGAGASQGLAVTDSYNGFAFAIGINSSATYNIIASSIVGGTISSATGGSFEQGSRAALYGMLFNELMNGWVIGPTGYPQTLLGAETELISGPGAQFSNAAVPSNTPACFELCVSIASIQVFSGGGSSYATEVGDLLFDSGGAANNFGVQAAGEVIKKFNFSVKVYNTAAAQRNIQNMCTEECNRTGF